MMQLIGSIGIEKVTIMTAKFFRDLLPKQSIYYLTPGTFVILIPKEDNVNALDTARIIYERYQEEWEFDGRDSIFHAAVFCVDVPKDFKSPGQIMSLIMSPMLPDFNKKNDVYYGEDLTYFLRKSRVEQAILHGLENHSFEVFYQPIYDSNDRSIRAGEALLRFHDSEMGEVYPDEFLPIAEKSFVFFIRIYSVIIQKKITKDFIKRHRSFYKSLLQ